MKKHKIKLLLVILTIIGLVSAGIFYACQNDQSNSIQDKTLQWDSHFITQNNDGTFVDVRVTTKDTQNTDIVIQNVEPMPDINVGIYFSEERIIQSQTENDSILEIELIKNEICWIVPLNGNQPIKMVPFNNEKELSGGTVSVSCTCYECTDGGFQDKCCEKKWYQGTNGNRYIQCDPKPSPCKCTLCRTNTTVRSGNESYNFNCSLFILQSKSITVNGVKYE